MGIFDKFKKDPNDKTEQEAQQAQEEQLSESAPTAHQGGGAASSPPEEMITVYDKFGRPMQITLEEWRTKVLPEMLKQSFDNPDALYQNIVMAVQDGFIDEVADASVKLMEIDPIKERATAVRAIVLMKQNNFDEAERIINQFIEAHGPTGVILTNLAKVHAGRGDEAKTEETLWKGLQMDPNQDNGLDWWAAIHQERSGPEGFMNAMLKAAEIQGSWRPQMWLAYYSLENQQKDKALDYYRHVLKQAGDIPVVLTTISGELGRHGFFDEVLDLILPIYKPEIHDVHAGINILQIYAETGNVQAGDTFLRQMYALNRPDIAEHLKYYGEVFDNLRQGKPPPVPPGAQQQIETIALNRPVWFYGLNNPEWLLQVSAQESSNLLFVIFANTTPQEDPESQQREDDIGRLTRSLPLYLAESSYFRTNARPDTMIAVMRGVGPVVFGQPLTEDQLLSFGDDNIRVVVSGSILETGDNLTIKVQMFDRARKTLFKELSYETAKPDLGSTVLKMEQDVLTCLTGELGFSADDPEDWYTRPCEKLMFSYLTGLGESLVLTLVENGLADPGSLWGEHNILEHLLALCLESEQSQVTKLMFLSALCKDRTLGSQVYQDFRQKALTLLKDETNPSSPFYRVSPLVYRLFDMRPEFEAVAEKLRLNLDPKYRDWLKSLTE